MSKENAEQTYSIENERMICRSQESGTILKCRQKTKYGPHKHYVRNYYWEIKTKQKYHLR